MIRFFVQKLTKSLHQQGRTMVEMLGVLAVIGVLSIGAVVGYRQAMSSKKANDVVKYLSSVSLQVTQNPKVIVNDLCEDYNNGRFDKPSFVSNCQVSFDPAKGVFLQVTYDQDSLSAPLVAALESRCSEQIYSDKINQEAHTQTFVWGDLTHECGKAVDDDPWNNGASWENTGGSSGSDAYVCPWLGWVTNACTCTGHTVKVYER